MYNCVYFTTAMQNRRFVSVGLVFLVAVYYISGYQPRSNEAVGRAIELENYHRRQHFQLLKDKNDFDRSTGSIREEAAPYIITGAKQCGIKIIERVLRFHSAVKVPLNPSLHFFDSPEEQHYTLYKYKSPMVSLYEGAVDITESYFEDKSTSIAKRVAMLPDTRVLLVVCDPIVRAVEDFAFQKFMGFLPKSEFGVITDRFLSTFKNVDTWLGFNETLAIEKSKYAFETKLFEEGIYFPRVKSWIQQFQDAKKRRSLLVMNGNEIINTPGAAIEKIENFFNLPKLILSRDLTKEEDGTILLKTPWLEDDIEIYFPGELEVESKLALQRASSLYNRLKEFYEPTNKKLYSITEDFGWS